MSQTERLSSLSIFIKKIMFDLYNAIRLLSCKDPDEYLLALMAEESRLLKLRGKVSKRYENDFRCYLEFVGDFIYYLNSGKLRINSKYDDIEADLKRIYNDYYTKKNNL